MTKAGMAITALVVLSTAGTAGAWFTGTQLEEVLQQSIEQGNQQLRTQFPETDLALELVDFEQGVFRSQARYRLVLQAAEDGDAGLDLFVTDHIEHGPLPLSRLVTLRWLPVMAISHAQLEPSDALAELFVASAGRPPVTLTSSVGYGNGVHGVFEAAPMSWVGDAGLKGTFSGLSAVYQTDTAGSKIKLTGRVDSLEIEGRARVSVAGVDFNLDRQRDASGLYLGTGKVELDQLAAVIDDKPALILNEILQSDQTSLGADGATVRLTYRIGSVNFGAHKLGAVGMDWTLSRLDPQASKALASRYNSAIFNNGKDKSQALKHQLQVALKQFLENHPRVSLDNLFLKTVNGESRLSFAVDLAQPDSLQLPPALLLPQLLGKLEARLVLSKPMLMDMVHYKTLFQPQPDISALEQEAEMLAEMVSGMAEMLQLGRVEGNDIISELSYVDGSVTLNGQAIELEELVGLMVGLHSIQ